MTMYGLDAGIKYNKINELSHLVQELSGMAVPSSRPFIGDGAYHIESGIVTGWFKNVFQQTPPLFFQ